MRCCDCCCMECKIRNVCKQVCPGGSIGPPGAQGIDGLTAYEVAVEAGYVGTIEEWLESLRGQKGDKGDSGVDIVGIQALTTNSSGAKVSKIPFDDVLRDNTNGIVEIQPDGSIIFHENGVYKIDWQITYDDIALGDSEVKVMFYVNNGPWAFTSTFGSRGQICGSELFISSLVGIEPPIYGGLTFRNSGGIALANTEIQANIVIVKLA